LVRKYYGEKPLEDRGGEDNIKIGIDETTFGDTR
jgi:hypothetical protein